MSEIKTAVWPVLRYQDGTAAIRFLVEAFGFTEKAVYEGDGGVIDHAELTWPQGGGVMLSSRSAEGDEVRTSPGIGSVYLVTDQPDLLHDRAVAARAKIVRGLRDEDYGSRGFTARDPEGVLWSFGTYAGEPD
ncbi:putative glyoxalase superfamily protein PhnB [Hamadaea flava]|uniref:VOC family protein n=1 Tax=Hamadaea flava TaxID=1742688 RepID=A0ABV8LVM3_9ACTN|nr:VOC family protein [Hamadaea flava]MCP2329086.1 putative glyoxalase superfamily protein PhnB [Hamadaea flava]